MYKNREKPNGRSDLYQRYRFYNHQRATEDLFGKKEVKNTWNIQALQMI